MTDLPCDSEPPFEVPPYTLEVIEEINSGGAPPTRQNTPRRPAASRQAPRPRCPQHARLARPPTTRRKASAR
jgi:hypothetical protein